MYFYLTPKTVINLKENKYIMTEFNLQFQDVKKPPFST